jgi:hypothetical protein
MASRRLAKKVRKLERQLARLDPTQDSTLHKQLHEELDLTRATLASYSEFLAERRPQAPARSQGALITVALLGLAALVGLAILHQYA